MQSFDDYCEEFGIKDEELPTAFAAYLNKISGGEWDGDYEELPADDAHFV
jgi:hypothetical protein